MTVPMYPKFPVTRTFMKRYSSIRDLKSIGKLILQNRPRGFRSCMTRRRTLPETELPEGANVQ